MIASQHEGAGFESRSGVFLCQVSPHRNMHSGSARSVYEENGNKHCSLQPLSPGNKNT